MLRIKRRGMAYHWHRGIGGITRGHLRAWRRISARRAAARSNVAAKISRNINVK